MAISLRAGRSPARRARPSFAASGVRIDPEGQPPSVDAAASQRLLLQAWQYQSFRYYNDIGEIHYASQFYARSLQNLRIYVGRKDAAGEIEEVDNSPQAEEILDDVQDPGGGRAGMLRAYGQLKWLIGEGYMIVTPSDGEGERNKWEFVSPAELIVLNGALLRQQAPGLPQRPLRYADDGNYEPEEPVTAVVYRWWQPHPMFSAQADAPMRGVLLLCDELERLTAAVRARSVSRMAGPGILLVPDEISQPPPEPVGDEAAQEDIFLRDLTEAAVAPITDPGTASAVFPALVRGAAEYLKEMRMLQIHNPLETYPEENLRTELIRRIAISLDFPPEVLLGVSDVNHWNAWQIDEQTWKTHLQPVAQAFCEDLTASYFKPACRDAGIDGWEDLCVWYDASEIINHPDRTSDAKDLWDRGAISLETLREVAGFDDDDAPSEEERAERIGIATRDSSLAWYGIPTIRGGNIEPAPGEVESATGTEAAPGAPTPPPAATGAEVAKVPPAPDGAVTAAGNLSEAVALTVDRCRELAGSRLRTRITRAPEDTRCSECADAIRDVPNGLVAAALAAPAAGLELPTPRELVAGGASLLREFAVRRGMDADQAALLAEQVERHAALTLFDERPPPMKGRR